MTTIAQALRRAAALGVERLDAQLLLGHHLQRSRAWLIAHDDNTLPATTAQAFEADCLRCADAVPLAYLLGEQPFLGLPLRVTPQVLVPRADTGVLVAWALEILGRSAAPAPRVLDLGTGSGAIALAVASGWRQARVLATDVSDDALAVAQANAQSLGLALDFALGSWWQAVPPDRFDLVLSNPPYIAGDDPHLADLRHEPRLALTPGGDGLGALRDIVAGAPQRLRAGGWLLLEHGRDQAEAVRALLDQAGFTAVETRSDLAGRPRCSGGQAG